MNRKEIIVVTPYLTEGGAERVLSELMNEWVVLNARVSLVCTHSELYKDTYKISNKIKVINLQSRGNLITKRLRRIISTVRLLNSSKNATIVAFMNSSIFLIAFCSLFSKNRIIFSERNDPNQDPPSKYRRFLRDIAFYRADCCVFQTDDAKKHFGKRIQNRGVIIPNPINKEIPAPFSGNKTDRIVAIGRLSAQKNMGLLIDAFSCIHKEHPTIVLDIYGRGELEDALKAQIKDLHLEGVVNLKGFSNDIYEEIKNAMMYVSSSNREGISNSMLEAMALGIPTICTDCPIGGARAIIHNGINGLLVPVNDVNSLSKAMLAVLEDKDLRLRLSKNGIKVREEYPTEVIAEKWLQLM